MSIDQDLEKLLTNLPFFIQEHLSNHNNKEKLIEIVMDLGLLGAVSLSFVRSISDRAWVLMVLMGPLQMSSLPRTITAIFASGRTTSEVL